MHDARRACRDSGMGPVALVPHGDVRSRTHRAAGSGRGPVEDSGAPGGARVRACAALPRADRSAIAERDGRESRLEECPEEVARLEGRGFALARHCRARTGAPSRNAMAGNPDWRSVRRKWRAWRGEGSRLRGIAARGPERHRGTRWPGIPTGGVSGGKMARLEGRGFALARHCRARTGAPSRNAMAGNPDWRSVRRKNGAPGGIRTPDQRLRKPLLYPAELQARDAHCPRFGRSTRASPIRSALR
jgi:hypothetical protein